MGNSKWQPHRSNSYIGQHHRLYIQHHESVNGVFDEAGYLAACGAVSNAMLETAINPVQGARLLKRKNVSCWRPLKLRCPHPYSTTPSRFTGYSWSDEWLRDLCRRSKCYHLRQNVLVVPNTSDHHRRESFTCWRFHFSFVLNAPESQLESLLPGNPTAVWRPHAITFNPRTRFTRMNISSPSSLTAVPRWPLLTVNSISLRPCRDLNIF